MMILAYLLLLQNQLFIKEIDMNKLIYLLLGIVSMLWAKDYEIEMLDIDNDGQTMLFSPGFIHIQPGDSVTFIPTHKSHWAKAIVVPNGAAKFESKLDEKASFSFEKEGIYIYECPPHKMMNMVGIIQVGKPTNLDSVKTAIPKIQKRASSNQNRLDEYIKHIKPNP